MSETPEATPRTGSYLLPTNGVWPHLWKVTAVLAAVGAIACVVIYDGDRFGFSWLFAFMTFLAIGLGGLFVTLAMHLTGAGWGVTPRRTAEFLLAALPVFAVLFLPIPFHLDEMYPWTHHQGGGEHHEEHEGEDGHHDEPEARGLGIPGAPSVAGAQEAADDHGDDDHGDDDHGEAAHGAEAGHGAGAEHGGEVRRSGGGGIPGVQFAGRILEPGHDEHGPEHAVHEEVIESKVAYLNPSFFYGRAIFYLGMWVLLSVAFFRWSTRQDETKDPNLTRRMETLAPFATIAFALTLTFAAFDWMMSLEPTWFSTIFGVQYFAVSAVSSLSTIILITLALRQSGVFGSAISVEHYHDLGKLLFGFLVFWGYVTFSQFMLIWYAGIPEEATYYHLRGSGAWQNVSTALVVAHFAIPFLLLISRGAKRRLEVLTFGAIWLLVMHVVEVYWLVLPYAEQSSVIATSLKLSPLDVAAFLTVGGTYLTVVFWLMGRFPLIPIGDPRLARALHHEVV